MEKVNRSLGWVQNPSSFKNLKRVIAVFDKESCIYEELYNKKIYTLIKDEKLKKEIILELKKEPYSLKYSLLKGKGNKKGKSRKDAECTGIIQAVILNQKDREYSDDWTADGFLRWGIAIGFLDYDREKDEVKITTQGLKYVKETDKKNEQKILIHAFLSYPPAVRILEILETAIHCTKFELGSQLGGLGEAGFTSIPQDLYVQTMQTSEKNEKNKTRSNTEGTADKYARMICTWLEKVKLIQKIPKEIKSIIGDKEYKAVIGHSYRITLDGIRELKGAKGTSSISKIPKIVYWEMLATKVKDRDYIRNRRAFIIKFIENKIKTLKEIKEYLKTKDIEEDTITIEDELKVIKAMGLNLEKRINGYTVNDKIVKLKIPKKVVQEKTDILKLKDKVRIQLRHINHRYLSLIDLAYDKSYSRDFEIQTIDLLINELKFKGLRLGETRKPDGIIYYAKKGVIIDNKAYSKGYNLEIKQADEMIRYIDENKKRDVNLNSNQWWKNFDENVEEFNFLFVTSYLIGNFQKNIEHISNRTKINGAAINGENLLYFAEEIKSGRISYNETFDYYQNNEIIFNKNER